MAELDSERIRRLVAIAEELHQLGQDSQRALKELAQAHRRMDLVAAARAFDAYASEAKASHMFDLGAELGALHREFIERALAVRRGELGPCTNCAGCGRVADDEDRTPWTHWLELPLASSIAVVAGIVKPLPCPACGGTGKGAVRRG